MTDTEDQIKLLTEKQRQLIQDVVRLESMVVSLEEVKRTLDIAIQSSERQNAILENLTKNIEEYNAEVKDLEARLVVLENRMNQ